MQKKIVLWATLGFMSVSSVHCQKTKVQDSSTLRKYLIGSSGFMIGNIFPDPPPSYQLNLSYKAASKDAVSLDAITHRYRHLQAVQCSSSFTAQENKWPDYFLFEPGLRFGFKF